MLYIIIKNLIKKPKKNNLMKTKVLKTAKAEEIIFTYKDSNNEAKEVSIIINQPKWEHTVEAFKALSDSEDRLDMITPGKLIFDLCVCEYSDEIDGNNQLLMSICSQLTSKYTIPVNAEIKKN